MDPLGKLFGSGARVKLLRLFLFNEELAFTADEAAFRTKIAKTTARREITSLVAVGVIRKKAGKGKAAYGANPRFSHYDPLRAFLRNSSGVSDTHITSSLKKAGSLRLVALSGIFTGVVESKVDLLIVGDKLDDRTVSTVVHALEAELGRELRYASFATPDFRYRVGVYDRLIRDVFDYSHRTILDKIGV